MLFRKQGSGPRKSRRVDPHLNDPRNQHPSTGGRQGADLESRDRDQHHSTGGRQGAALDTRNRDHSTGGRQAKDIRSRKNIMSSKCCGPSKNILRHLFIVAYFLFFYFKVIRRYIFLSMIISVTLVIFVDC